jgi:hypothetical protein
MYAPGIRTYRSLRKGCSNGCEAAFGSMRRRNSDPIERLAKLVAFKSENPWSGPRCSLYGDSWPRRTALRNVTGADGSVHDEPNHIQWAPSGRHRTKRHSQRRHQHAVEDMTVAWAPATCRAQPQVQRSYEPQAGDQPSLSARDC